MIKINKFKTKQNREFVVIDHAVELKNRTAINQFVTHSLYKIGGTDTEYSNYPYLISEYSLGDVESLGLIDIFNNANINITYDDINRTLINLSLSNEPHWYHTHFNESVILYYVNQDWCQEWGGETLFMNDSLTEIEYASAYTPGRIIIFDGNIPHTLRPQSMIAPTYRFTLAMFVNKTVNELVNK